VLAGVSGTREKRLQASPKGLHSPPRAIQRAQ
jgi:hypothetical protein